MRRTRLWFVVILACAGFGLAWVARERGRTSPLVAWKPDARAHADDKRQVARALGRIPPPLPGTQGAGSDAKPDVVVIVLDTVRADRLSVYDAGLDTTPNLTKWAQDARVYTRMQSVGAWTLPSHASLFTGQYPVTHGAEGTPRGVLASARALHADADTLARRLKGAGWQTVGIAGNRAYLDRRWGLSQGFDAWLCEGLAKSRDGIPYVTADRVVDMATQVLEAPRTQPLFLFLNFMDAHAPYIPREGYVRDPAVLEPGTLPYAKRWPEVRERLLATGKLDPDIQRSWTEAYDSELRFLDAQLARLFASMAEHGIGPEDQVVILADHGEYLGDHGYQGHSQDLYEQVLHIPLLVRSPGVQPGRDDAPVQTTDVPSMVLRGVGLPAFGEPLPVQVSELYWSRKRDLDHPLYWQRFDRIRRAYRLGFHKVIVGTDGSFEAYDLSVDPQELRSTPTEAWATALRAQGEALFATLPVAGKASAEDMVEENAEALKALGYTE